jgi:Na+-transporting methylmalonyl-CoA/oxaloacetate decarboxylase gamma subunit
MIKLVVGAGEVLAFLLILALACWALYLLYSVAVRWVDRRRIRREWNEEEIKRRMKEHEQSGKK